MFDRVIVDYGHGGMIDGEDQTPGSKQYHFTEPEKFSIYEGVFNRRVASKLMSILTGAGIEVYDCVEDCFVTEPVSAEELEQRNISLGARVRNANRENKRGKTLFVSIHANAIGDSIRGPSQGPQGASVFVYRNSGLISEVANRLLEQYSNTSLRPRRIVENKSFYVLRKTAMPAMLTENGFFTNIEDAKYLMTDTGQWEIAQAHFQAMKDLLDIGEDSVL
tara:strand:+ start:59 stop:721 length:663 start_codon:yes stop_codon:yes gene_type:complete